jgi:hypothetical protein
MMRLITGSTLSALTLSAVISLPASAQIDATPDPERAQLVYEDLRNFSHAFEQLSGTGDSIAVLQAEYFDRASPGLAAFVDDYDLTPELLLNAIREHPAEYAAVKDKIPVLEEEEARYRAAYADLAAIVPNPMFTPTYFLVGSYRGIGSGSRAGTLITFEKHSVESLRGDIITLLVHEMAHMQQALAMGVQQYQAIYGPEGGSLLAFTIREGVAEYMADRVTGRMTQEDGREFLKAHERELWQRFEPEMLGAETGDWMWSRPSDPDQPAHIGYVLGARIVSVYYENAEDKDQAIRDILAVTDYPTFLERSGYPGWESRRVEP